MTHKYQSPTHRNKVNLDLYRIENKTTTINSLWKLKSMLLSSKRKKHKHISICQNIDNFIIYCTFYEQTFRSPSIIIDASCSFVFNMYLYLSGECSHGDHLTTKQMDNKVKKRVCLKPESLIINKSLFVRLIDDRSVVRVLFFLTLHSMSRAAFQYAY